MLGVGTAPRLGIESRSESGPGSETDETVRGLELCGDDPRRAVRRDPFDLDVLERGLLGFAQPLPDPVRVAGDLPAGTGDLAVGAREEERRVGQECVRTCRYRGWQFH